MFGFHFIGVFSLLKKMGWRIGNSSSPMDDIMN